MLSQETGGWTEMYNEKLHDEYSTWNIIRTVKKRENEGGFSSHDVIERKKYSKILKRINNLKVT